jgi:dihydroflavonol-4-reductase
LGFPAHEPRNLGDMLRRLPAHTLLLGVAVCCLVPACSSAAGGLAGSAPASRGSARSARGGDGPEACGAGVRARGAAGAGAGDVLRLRGGAFWLSAVAGPEEKRAFWRQLSTAPAHWIRDRMQRLCPFGAKEANIAAKELAALMETSPTGGRLRGGGLTHGGPKAVLSSQPPTDLQLDSREPFAQAGDVVVVTGATGFVAGHVIRELTEKGFKVRGTVRNLTDTAKTQHLRSLFPDLELFEADLLDDGSFLECCKGARFVVHCASPFKYVVDNPEEDLVEPAVKGTMNVLRCARHAGGVRRVVITSSTASVCTFKPPSDTSWQWTEDDWNTDTTLEDNPYRYSKTLAEQAAWLWMGSCYNSHDYGIAGGFEDSSQVRAALQSGGQKYDVSFDLVVINPSFVTGPTLSTRTEGESTKLIKEMLEGVYTGNGTKGGGCIGMVDVRDVAAAHVSAVMNPAAFGRYVVSSEQGISHLEVASYLAADSKLASLPLPKHAESPTTYRPLFNTAKAQRDLGLRPRLIAESVVEAAHDLLAKGLVDTTNMR